MKVLAYPVTNYSGDASKLPVILSDNGEFVLKIEYGNHVDLELVKIFICATRQGCQWIVFKNKPILTDEKQWLDI